MAHLKDMLVIFAHNEEKWIYRNGMKRPTGTKSSWEIFIISTKASIFVRKANM